MATKKPELLTSPVGEIQFMAIANPVTNDQKDQQEYIVKIALDSKKDAAWIAEVAKLNPNIPVTAATYRGSNEAVKKLLESGKTLIKAASKYAPTVFDSNLEVMEEAPLFFADSKGTAKISVSPYKGKKGGSINLVSVQIHSLDAGEQSAEGTTSREDRLSRLKAALAAGE